VCHEIFLDKLSKRQAQYINATFDEPMNFDLQMIKSVAKKHSHQNSIISSSSWNIIDDSIVKKSFDLFQAFVNHESSRSIINRIKTEQKQKKKRLKAQIDERST
jgi:hypothetical protein